MTAFWILVAGFMISNLGQYSFYLIMMISIINTVEYNEYKRGVRDEAIIASLRPFLTKLASAFIVIITSASYLIFGVTKFTNQISEFERAAELGSITAEMKLSSISQVISGVGHLQTLGLLLCMTVRPCLLMYITYVLYLKHYKLDEDEYERICAEIAQRKAGAGK